MTRSLDLYNRYSAEELQAMATPIKRIPENQMPKGSLYLYTPKARKKLDDIAWAIQQHIADNRMNA